MGFCGNAFVDQHRDGIGSFERQCLDGSDQQSKENGAKRAREFQRETDQNFAFGGGRTVAREERLEGGFTEEEIAEIEGITSKGPSRETLLRAAEILRDRHRARLAEA